jgi:hypothetical protein
VSETTSMEALADTIEAMPDAGTTAPGAEAAPDTITIPEASVAGSGTPEDAMPITIAGSGTEEETPPITIDVPQKTPACGLCKRVFKFGDYVCITTFSVGSEPAKKGILCKRCYGSGKDRSEARIVLFTNGEVSSVNRDRAWKRSKKLERMAKKQQSKQEMKA